MMRHLLLVATVLFACLPLQAQQPTQSQVDALIQQAQTDISARLARLKADIDVFYAGAQATTVPLGASLQAAIVKAGVGATLHLAAGYETTEPIAIAKAITINGAGAQLRGGLVITGPGVTVNGPTVTKIQARDDVVILTGDRTTLTEFFVRGDRVRGQKRGILGNATNLAMRKVDVRDIWTARGLVDADIDSQAFACWDGCQDVLIEDSFFSGSTETFLVGGADAANAMRQPARITLRRTTLTKDLAWKANPAILVKNVLELKNVNTFVFEDGTIEYAWAQGQGGYAIVLTPRNQDFRNPWASVEHVTIQRSRIQHAAAFVTMLGIDNEAIDRGTTSGPLRDVKLLANTYDDIDPKIWQVAGADGSRQFIQVLRGPQSVTIDGNKPGPIGARNIGSSVYFADSPKAIDFVLTNNVLPVSTYGIFGEGAAPEFEDGRRVWVNGLPRAWPQWVASGTLSGNTER